LTIEVDPGDRATARSLRRHHRRCGGRRREPPL